MREDEFYKEVGKRIKMFRINHGLTQSDLCKRINISRPSLANMEAGRQRIHLFLLHQLSEELDTPIIEIILEK